jgi:hypothetical protein
MSGWNGSGGFTLPFDWTVDAANAVPISSSRMMTQENTLVSGLLNCQTLDSQTKPIANLDFNSFKGVNVAPGVNPTDAANFAQVSAGAGLSTGTFLPYNPGTGFTWVSATSFTINGIDATGVMLLGRRIKVVHNSGATTTYGTVLSSVFSTNTTVTVFMDGNTALVSTVTALSVGLESPSPYALPHTSIVNVAVLPTVTSGTQVHNSILNGGTLAEGSTAFIPTYSGVYRMDSMLILTRAGATMTGAFQMRYGASIVGSGYINGAQAEAYMWLPSAAGWTIVVATRAEELSLTAGQPVDFSVGDASSTFTGGPSTARATIFITRLQ